MNGLSAYSSSELANAPNPGTPNNIVLTDVVEVTDVNAVIAIGILDGGDLIIFKDSAA